MSKCIYIKNIQTLATEMFKVKYDLFPDITCNIFVEGENNLRYRKDFRTPLLESIYQGKRAYCISWTKGMRYCSS